MNRKYVISFIVIALFLSGISFWLQTRTPTTSKNETLSSKNDSLPLTEVKFEETVHDFGKVIAGEDIYYKYKFKNVGKHDLVIRNVQATCGCTVPKWKREPIKPNEESEIEVQFHTVGRYGGQHKTIRLFANIPQTEFQLSFTAEVIPENEKK